MNKNERRNNALQESRSVSENLTFMERLRGLRLDFSLDGESILKGIVCAVLLVFFLPAPDDAVHKIPTARCSSGSCLAARYSHFYDGKGTLGRNNWANRCYSNRITRRIYVHDSADSLYLRGYFCGILTTHYFRDSVATRALYTLVSTVARVFFTLIALFATTGNVTLLDALTKAALPEFFACIIFAPLPHIAAKLCLHRFNKSREERTHE